MNWTLRVTKSFLDDVRRELARPHDHAYERVGFVICRLGNQAGEQVLLLPAEYQPVADEHYIRDEEVGARISADAIRRAMGVALQGGAGVFHVHLHEHHGRPRFSATDIEGYPPLIRALMHAGPKCPHGALLLSQDRAECLVWLPGAVKPAPGGRIVVVGRPMGFARGGEVYA